MPSAVFRLLVRLRALWPGVPRWVSLGSSLAVLAISVLLVVDLFGLRTHSRERVNESRKMVVETLAVHLSTLIGVDDAAAVQFTVGRFVVRNDDAVAAVLQRTDGPVIGTYGEQARFDAPGAAVRMVVPIYENERPWGELRVLFEPDRWLARDLVWFASVALGLFLAFAFFLQRVLVQLDPGRAVPGRVDSALNLFSAGIVVLDANCRIVTANRAAERIAGGTLGTLMGHTLDELPWKAPDQWQAPWRTTLHSGLALSDQSLELLGPAGENRIYSVSCVFVGDDAAGLQGVLVTLDDLTSIERKNQELAVALQDIRRSQEAINRKNRELEILATTDPLTGVANRRTLMERIESELVRARRDGYPLACIMSDIDHFKSVNDTYGHGVGDDVIRAVAATLEMVCRDEDLVGRYGGEEFVVVLPGLSAAQAAEVAERARIAVVALAVGDRLAVPRLASSFGISDLTCEPEDGPALIDAADRALYQAKQNGRNRVEIVGEAVSGGGAEGAVSADAPPVDDDTIKARLVDAERRLDERDRDLQVLREFDALTGAPMSVLFLQRLATELTRGTRHGTRVSVLSLELSDFERIVATFGHAAADALVVAFVQRLQEGLRTTDVVSPIAGANGLSRVASNEYGVLVTELLDAAGVMIVITRLKRCLSHPFLVGDSRVYLGIGVGIALSDVGDEDAATLLDHAGEARLIAASKPEKFSHHFASKALDDQSNEYIRLEADLHEALENGDLETWFQPKFDLAQRRVTGAEALLRWRHERRGFVSPEVFIPIAEANGMIDRLSSFVLGRVMECIRLWRELGFDELRVSINISPMQLRAASLVPDMLAALEAAGVPGRQLEIELTETSVIDRMDEARQALDTLRAAGVHVSLDDFGTGYTSLTLLAQLPLDTIKIDRSFIVGMARGERDEAMIRSIVSMAHTLGLRVVAEGVETNDELETLAAMGCDEVQGYLISRPHSAEETTAFLVRQRTEYRKKSA